MQSHCCDLLDDCFTAVCEHGYSLAQNLDPNSEGRGVLQFKTGLMSVIKVCFSSVHSKFDTVIHLFVTYHFTEYVCDVISSCMNSVMPLILFC